MSVSQVEVKENITDFLNQLVRSDGGYAGQISDNSSSLQNTLSVLKALKLLGSAPGNAALTLSFIKSCFVTDSGAFSDQPGLKPSVFTTAVGLLALHDIKVHQVLEEYLPAALEYMIREARSAADHFMIIAVFDECKLPPPAPKSSVAYFNTNRQSDGTFGKEALTNAIAIAALLRAGEDVENTQPVIQVLLQAQNSQGGFVGENGESDLMTTYAVMRALTLLNISPNLPKLEDYLHSLAYEDEGYGKSPGSVAEAGATYQVLNILYWIERFKESKQVIESARSGDVEFLVKWLSGGGDPDLYDEEGWTPLLAASSRGKSKIVELLLFHKIKGAKHANPNLRFTRADALPIYMAGQSGDLETVKILLKAKPNHLFDISSVNGHTVLLQAAFFGKKVHLDLAHYLLENLADILSLPISKPDLIEQKRKELTVATNVRGYNGLRMNTELWMNEPMADLFRRYDKSTRAEQDAYLDNLLIKISTPQQLTESLFDVITKGFEKMRGIPASATVEIENATEAIFNSINKIIRQPHFEINRLGGALQQPAIVFAITGVDKEDHVKILRKNIAKYLLDNKADPDFPEKHPMGIDAVIRAAVLNNFEILKLISKYMKPYAFNSAS